MFLLDWRLAVFSLALTPVFVLMRAPRRQPAQAHHGRQAGRDGRHLLARAGVAQRVRHPARQVDGPRRRARRPLRARVGRAGRPRGPLAHGRALDDGDDPDVVRGHAGARLPVRRPRRRRGLDRHGRGVHHAADAHLLADPVAAQRRRRHPELGALFERVFEYLDLPVDIHPGERARSTPRGDVRSTTSGSATRRRRLDAGGRRPRGPGRARGPRSSARPARARRRSATSSRGSTTPSAARSGSTASTCAT